MKLVTYIADKDHHPLAEMLAPRRARGQAGIVVGDKLYDLSQYSAWVQERIGIKLSYRANTMQHFVELPAEQRHAMCKLVGQVENSALRPIPLASVKLRAPLETPPSLRDFYAFEQHVKTARSNRGLGMIPEWYKFPVFYFSNHRAIYASDDYLPYPRQTAALDFELEMACVIGTGGRDIPAERGSEHIAGYLIMNDWSARDLQMEEMKLGMGPAKGKDFATSLGPYLVTPDELESVRVGEGANERFDLPMVARLNGKEISRGNFKDIYFSFPQIIERASLNSWLEPGDIIGSGTVGTGCLLEQGDKRERWLQVGDTLELEIARLGILRNVIVAQEDYPG